MIEPEAAVGSLAAVFPAQAPGLPRGRARMPADQLSQAQRERILRAAISAFADLGFDATTIADIVTRARVSRGAFYRLFDTKEACFLAAIDDGTDALLPKIAAAAGTAPTTDGIAGAVRATVREYLRVAASEPEFTRAWTLELPVAGPAALRRRNQYFDALAAVVGTAHTSHRPGHEPLPHTMYLALIGGCHELFYRYVSDGQTTRLPELEEPIVTFVLHHLR